MNELWLQTNDVQVATLATPLDSERKLAMRRLEGPETCPPALPSPEECTHILEVLLHLDSIMRVHGLCPPQADVGLAYEDALVPPRPS